MLVKTCSTVTKRPRWAGGTSAPVSNRTTGHLAAEDLNPGPLRDQGFAKARAPDLEGVVLEPASRPASLGIGKRAELRWREGGLACRERGCEDNQGTYREEAVHVVRTRLQGDTQAEAGRVTFGRELAPMLPCEHAEGR